MYMVLLLQYCIQEWPSRYDLACFLLRCRYIYSFFVLRTELTVVIANEVIHMTNMFVTISNIKNSMWQLNLFFVKHQPFFIWSSASFWILKSTFPDDMSSNYRLNSELPFDFKGGTKMKNVFLHFVLVVISVLSFYFHSIR